MNVEHNLKAELPLLALLALLWGSSYLFIEIAVTEIPPITLIAIRVTSAAAFLLVVMMLQKETLPRDGSTWRMLLLQAFFNSIGAWTVLAWGQQFVGAGLASVLNSTSPIFVFLFTAMVTRHEILGGRKLLGALVGFFGVVLIVGIDALRGAGTQVAGQVACLLGAALYGCAAINGRNFRHLSALNDSHRHNDLRGSDTRSARLHCRTAIGGKPVSESHRRDSHALCLLYRGRAAALFSSCPDDRLNGRCEPKLLTGRGGRNPRHGISGRDSCSSRRSWYRGGDNRCCPHQLADGEQAATDVLIISSLSPLRETRQGPCGPRTIRSFAPASWCQACSVRVRLRTTSTPSLASIRCPAS